MSNYQSYIDSLILKALKEDDEKPLSHLFEFYYNRLYRSGLRLCSEGALVEECIQEVFLDLWIYRQTLGEILSLDNYLKIALRRRIFKRLQRKDPLSISHDFDPDNTPSVMTTESYEDILIQQQTDVQTRQRLIAALEELSPKQREIIHLKYFEELSYKEIVDKTGVEIGTLYKLLHDAIKKLKIILENK
jgi:RNA polymerase sigma factor (sigma-70 family)